MLPVLSGVFMGWLAATILFAGLAFTWFLLGKLFPRQPAARFWVGLLLFVLGALPAVALGLFIAYGSASLVGDTAIAWSTRGAFVGTAFCTLGVYTAGSFFRKRHTPPNAADDAVDLDEPMPPPLPQSMKPGTFPAGHRFGPPPPLREETIHFGDPEPDPPFTLAEMQALQEECAAEDRLVMMRDARVASQN